MFHFNIILPSVPTSPKSFLGFYTPIFYAFHLSAVCIKYPPYLKLGDFLILTVLQFWRHGVEY